MVARRSVLTPRFCCCAFNWLQGALHCAASVRLLSSVVLGASPADTVLVRGTLHVNASLAFAQNALWKAGALVTGTQGARFERRAQPQKSGLAPCGAHS